MRNARSSRRQRRRSSRSCTGAPVTLDVRQQLNVLQITGVCRRRAPSSGVALARLFPTCKSHRAGP
jgi:hypothetical protein